MAAPSVEAVDSAEEVLVVAGSKCPSCGKLIQRHGKFCPECGAGMIVKRGATMGLGKTLMILAAAVIGGVLLVGGCFYGGYNKAIAFDDIQSIIEEGPITLEEFDQIDS